VDILSDLGLQAMIASHLEQKSLATLAVRERETARYFLFDGQMRLRGWMNRKTGETRPEELPAGFRPLAFSGIQVIGPGFFPLISEEGKFSLTDVYLRLCSNWQITGYADSGDLWRDAGSPD
jgi:NDP-sugar pyrophosphorylase family protein